MWPLPPSKYHLLHLAVVGNELWCDLSLPVESSEGRLVCGHLQVLAADGETLLSRATGDLQHLQLHFVNSGHKLQFEPKKKKNILFKLL